MISIQLIFASHKRDKSKFPKIESDLTDTAKSNIDSFLKSSTGHFGKAYLISTGNREWVGCLSP